MNENQNSVTPARIIVCCRQSKATTNAALINGVLPHVVEAFSEGQGDSVVVVFNRSRFLDLKGTEEGDRIALGRKCSPTPDADRSYQNVWQDFAEVKIHAVPDVGISLLTRALDCPEALKAIGELRRMVDHWEQLKAKVNKES